MFQRIFLVSILFWLIDRLFFPQPEPEIELEAITQTDWQSAIDSYINSYQDLRYDRRETWRELSLLDPGNSTLYSAMIDYYTTKLKQRQSSP